MKIFDISISNFRGIKNIQNLRCGSINTIVGKNDAGKSSVVKAVVAFFSEKIKPEDVFQGIGENERVEIKIRFEPSVTVNSLALDSQSKIAIQKEFYFDRGGKLKVEVFYFCNDINHQTVSNVWGAKESDLNGFLEQLVGNFTRSGRGVTNLSKIEKIEETTINEARTEKKYPADEFLKNINKQYPEVELPELSVFEAEQSLDVGATNFQSQFKSLTAASLEKNKHLTDQIETEVTSDLTTEFDVITTIMQKNVPEIEHIKPKVICNWNSLVKFDLSLKFKNEAFDVPISNKGTGFKRLLMVAYFEYLASKQTKQHQIFAIEEPETYLHPSLQVELLNSIIALSDNSQFFLTTHSPIFAGATNETNIVIVRKENSISNFLSSNNSNEILDLVIQELGIRPNYNLLNDNYRKVVFVEGKGDVLFWEMAITKLNGGLPNDILFIPCGGDQVEFFVNASLCRKISRKFLFVLDSDNGATDYATKQANKATLAAKVTGLGGEFHMLRKREIENYYHMEAIKRLFPTVTFPPDFGISDYNDVQKDIKDKILAHHNINFKTKNNMAIFTEMTTAEWAEVGFSISATEKDIQVIISKIIE
jgi:putative ATP-dependent endonuclease of OLD family